MNNNLDNHQQTLKLSLEASEHFVDVLQDGSEPNEKLKKAVEKYNKNLQRFFDAEIDDNLYITYPKQNTCNENGSR